MTLEDAIKRLKKEYEKAKANPYVRDPVAFALYQTWKVADNRFKKE